MCLSHRTASHQQVTFQPVQSNRNYFSELEAYVFFKNQRTFRLVNDPTATPPWCVPLFTLPGPLSVLIWPLSVPRQ